MKPENKENFNVEKKLSEEECRKIIEELGLEYLGIQEGYKNTPPYVLFVSSDPRLDGTSIGLPIDELTPENIQKVIKERLKMFKGKLD